ncbi:MAG: hypothetical protein IJ567_09440 [Lachnospiraceae bacterium]|nr:hypothetical protein [Lachnospiraceae bacterium]
MLKNIQKKGTQILSNVRSSSYLKWIRNNRGNLFGCTLISIFLSILSYPGIIYSDSYGRIEFTSSIKMSLHAFFTGNADLTETSFWLTVTPSFFMLLSKEIAGSILLYTFVQCLALFFVTFAFADKLNSHRYTKWNTFGIILSPVMWAFGVYYEASVGCITAIMVVLLLLWKWGELDSSFDKILTIILMVFSSFVCFGYRANAFSIIPVLIIIIILKEKRLLSRIILVLAIGIGFLSASFLPKMLHINTMSSYAAGFAWEIVSTIQTMHKDTQTKYIDYMDDIFGDGATAVAVHKNSYDEQGSSINSMFESPVNSESISSPGNPEKIIKKYLKLAYEEPMYFMNMKYELVSHSLGIGKPVNMFEYDYNRWDRMNEFGFNDSHPRKVYVNYFLSYMQFMKVFRMPWLFYVLCLTLIIVYRLFFVGMKSSINLYEATYGVAVFYYGAYILNTQSFEFRYYFPSWLLMFLIIIALSSEMLLMKSKKKILLSFVVVFVFVSLWGGYKEYVKVGSETIVSVQEQGISIYEDEAHHVFLKDNHLYFISSRKSDDKYTYFLHYYSNSGDMINNDFVFADHSIPTAFWNPKIAVIEIPEQSVNSIEFGQYYGKTRFWEYWAELR